MKKIAINKDYCKSCGYCTEFCPVQALYISEDFNKNGYNNVDVNEGKCISCGSCYIICPDYVFTISKGGN